MAAFETVIIFHQVAEKRKRELFDIVMHRAQFTFWQVFWAPRCI